MTVQHYVLFTFRADVATRERMSLVSAMERFLGGQRYSSSWHVGRDLGLREGNASVLVNATFPDVAAFADFQADAGHLALLAEMRPAILARAAIQVPDVSSTSDS